MSRRFDTGYWEVCPGDGYWEVCPGYLTGYWEVSPGDLILFCWEVCLRDWRPVTRRCVREIPISIKNNSLKSDPKLSFPNILGKAEHTLVHIVTHTHTHLGTQNHRCITEPLQTESRQHGRLL